MGGAKRVAKHPFPFVGAGDADYFEWGGVTVCFQAEPGPAERARITAAMPPPIADPMWSGRFLSAHSDQMIHLAISSSYDADAGEQDELNGRPIFAAPSKVTRFNRDIDRWLREAHAVSPICVAYRAEDHEAGGTRLSAWHRESLVRLPSYLPALADVMDGDRDSVGAELLRGVLEFAGDHEPPIPIPERFAAWLHPEADALGALARGDGGPLRLALMDPADDLLEALADDIDVTDPRVRTGLLQAARDLMALTRVSWRLLGTLAAAVVAEDEPRLSLLRDICARCDELHQSPEAPLREAMETFADADAFELMERTLRLALELFPDRTRVASEYAYRFTRNQQFDKANEELLDRCTALSSNDLVLLLNITYVWIERRQFRKALHAIDQYCAEGHAMARDLWLNKSMSHFGLGDHEAALDAAASAIKAGDLGGHMMQAAVAAARGERDEALALLRTAKKTYRRFSQWRTDWCLAPLHADPAYRALFGH